MGGAASAVGGAISGGTKAVGAGAGALGGLLGTGNKAGILGVGQFEGDRYNIDKAAFSDEETKKRQAEFAAQLAASQNRAAQQVNAAQINSSPQEQFRNAQLMLTNQLQQQAAGQGPSLAQSQLRQGTDRNIQQAMAMAASQRGANAGQGLRGIGMQAAQANQQAAAQSADLRAQEQMAARQQVAGVLQGGRAQDVGLATEQATLQQQAALANQQAGLQQQSLNDQQARFYNSSMADMDQKNREARMAHEQMNTSQVAGLNTVNAGGYANASESRGSLVGGIGSAFAAMSDEDQKMDVKPGENKTSSFLESISKAMAPAATGGEEERYAGQKKTGMALGQGLGAMFGMSMPAAGAGGAGAAGAGGGMAAAAPMAAAASDERLKTGISGGNDDISGFLNALKAHEYQYKDKKFGDGTYVSPMAQEIEKTKLGKDMVLDTPEGKVVDYGRAGGVMLASAAMLNDKVKALESKLEKALSKKGGK